MKPAVLTGSMAIPIGSVDIARLRKDCTISHQPMGADEPLKIQAYREDDEYIYVPRQLGLRICRREGIEYQDRTSQGVAVEFPSVPQPRDYQVDVLDEIDFTSSDYYDYLFRARTGWGKTIGSLIFAARRGVSTLIVVDQENLKTQWIKALKEHFGLDDSRIGVIQGKVCKYEDCPVTIAMVQTLSQRRFAQEVYDHFGLMILDEVHVIGAPTFSSILLDFSATLRIGVSATPKRRDGLQKMLDYHLGRVRVYVEDQHTENSVYVAEHGTVYSWYANVSKNTGRFITEVSEDASRNLLIAESVGFLYDTGRDVLVLSDRIEHLKHLMSLCVYLGLPEEDMGLYAGYNPVYGFAKDPTPPRRPLGYVRKTEYTPVSLQLIAKRAKKATLEEIKNSRRIIFATYGMFQKGVDVPRLTAGIDASPRSRAEQVHGRILRGMPGALRPIWITIADFNSYRSLFGLAARLPEYVRNNARLFRWSLDEGAEPCQERELVAQYRGESERLQSLRIEPNSDGLNTLMTPSTRIESAKTAVLATKKRIQERQGLPRVGLSRAASKGKLSATTSSTQSPVRPSRFLKRQRR